MAATSLETGGWLCSLEDGVLLVSCCFLGLFLFLRFGGVPASSVEVDDSDSDSDTDGDEDADGSVELESCS